MGLFDWIKYTRVINSAEKKFVDAYNFEIPLENKTQEVITALAFTTLHEEARINKLLAEDYIAMTKGLAKKSPLYQYIMPSGSSHVDWFAYENIYTFYISNRAKGIDKVIAFASAVDVYDTLVEENIKATTESTNAHLAKMDKEERIRKEQERISLIEEAKKAEIEAKILQEKKVQSILSNAEQDLDEMTKRALEIKKALNE
jgi:hypothetical protein